MESGRGAFRLLEVWTGEPFGTVAGSATWLIHTKSLTTLTSTSKLTRHGAVGGGFVVEHPLRAALSLPRSQSDDDVAAPLLAIALLKELQAPGSSNVKIVGTAVHNQKSEGWAKIFSALPRLTDQSPRDYLDSLASSCVSLLLDKNLRQTDRAFLREVEKCAMFADNVIEKSSARHRSKIVKGKLLLGSDDDEGDSRLIQHDVDWQADPTDTSNAGEPDITLFADDPSPPKEIDRVDKTGLATPSTRQLRAAFRTRTANQYSEFHWRSLSPPEISFLVNEAAQSFKSDAAEERMIGALVLLSIVLGKTPQATGKVVIAHAGNDEGINLARRGYLRKIPHPPQAWMAGDLTVELNEIANTIDLTLPETILAFLSAKMSRDMNLRPIWSLQWRSNEAFDQDLSNWTTQRSTRHRITPRRIANILLNRVFADCGRHAVVYWLFLSHDDPPPSGVYYTAYPVHELRRLHLEAWTAIFEPVGLKHVVHEAPNTNQVVGSRLQVPTPALKSLSGFLRSGVRQYEGTRQSLIHSHNTFVAYTLTLLNFATGHRPVTDPFDGFGTISISEGYALIDDKNLDIEHSARIVPLAASAIAQIRNYEAHLHGVASLLARWDPKMAARILAQLHEPQRRLLPTFFLLSDAHEWVAVQPSLLATYLPTSWLYPANAHRHALASQLSLRNVEEYVINQLMGHVDAGTASISGLSKLAPGDVFNGVRPILEDILKSFDFLPLGSPLNTVGEVSSAAKAPHAIAPATFGRERRAEIRAQIEEREVGFVRKTLESFLATKSPDDKLTDGDIRKFIEQVQKRSITFAFRHDQVRMDALRTELTALKERTHASFFIPRKRVVLSQESAYFRPQTLIEGARARLLQTEFSELLSNLKAPLPKNDNKAQTPRRFAYAVLSVIALARLSDSKAIQKYIISGQYLVHAGENNTAYLQFAVNSSNVRRIPLDEVTAHLLLPVPRDFPEIKVVEQDIRAILSHLPGSYIGRGRQSTIEQLCRLVDARNRLDLPGQLADYLSGTTRSAALPFQDWVRTEHRRFLPSINPASSHDEPSQVQIPVQELEAVPANVKADEAHASEFIKAITRVLSHAATKTSFDASVSKGRGTTSYPTPEKVQTLDQTVQHLAKKGTLAPIGAMAASWIKTLMTVGSTEGRVVLSTVRRYWADLKRDAIPLAYSLTYEEISAGALEEIYHQAIDITEQHQEYVRKVLGLFHGHIESTFGVPPVDWSEVLPETYENDADVINPSILPEWMYFHVLQLLKNDVHVSNQRERESATLLVILMYRFGLRTSEARGLLLRDIFLYDDRYYLRVAPNFARKIKTDAGIRFVPAIDALTALESGLIAQFCAAGESFRSHDPLAMLFASELNSRDLSGMTRVCARAADAIAEVAGSKSYSLYALRHSFVSRVHVEISQTPSIGAMPLGLSRPTHGEHANRLLAIVTGHVHSGTTLKHYCHRFHTLLDRRRIQEEANEKIFRAIGAIKVESAHEASSWPWQSLRDLPEYQLPLALPPPRIRPGATVGQIEQAVRFLRLVRSGHPAGTIPALLQTTADSVALFQEGLKKLDRECNVVFSKGVDEYGLGTEGHPDSQRINHWLQLAEAARKLDAAFAEPEFARAALRLVDNWFRYVSSDTDVTLLDPSVLPDLRELLTRVDISLSDVLIYLAAHDRDCDWFAGALSKATALGFNVEEVTRIARPRSQPSPKRVWPRFEVSIKRQREGSVRNARQLGMLLMSIWLVYGAAT